MNYQAILDSIHKEVLPELERGAVASYIPELSKVSKYKFGIALQTVDQDLYTSGDAQEAFSIQSISKLFSLAMAINIDNNSLWQRVGREPSGTRFNSIAQLEQENGIPRNPFINAGALVITDLILENYPKPTYPVLEFINSLLPTPTIKFDVEVAQSELEHGHGNLALANFIKNYHNLNFAVDAVMQAYCYNCSIAMSCVDLCQAGLFLANEGLQPQSQQRITSQRNTKYINSLMLTSGTYDDAGEFAYKVGLPCKSGVGGGILAIMPKQFSLCVWSPGLNQKGNSLAGYKALELFTTKTGISIF